MKVILIPVSDSPECALALHYGFIIGKQTQSSVVGCHIRPHSSSDINLPDESTASIITVDSYDLAWEAALKEKGKDEDHIKAKILFKNLAQQFNYNLCKKHQNKPNALWFEKVGSPDKLFAIMGPMSDLIIVSRPAKKGRSMARTFMFNAVINSSVPVIVLPQENINNIGSRICIAWNQSTEACFAVKAAIPLLKQANEVNIVTNGSVDRLGPKAIHLQKYLCKWNIKTNHLARNDRYDKLAIMKAYEETNSNLLIMGGYSRSRFRERMFGGVSEYMLNNVQIPLFILHI